MNDLLQGNVKGKTPVNWTPATVAAFEACKESLAGATLLAHLEPNAPLAIFSNTSDFAVGAVLQQRINGDWQSLDFFSKKLSPTEQFSVINYLSVKYFRHMVEARSFTIYTDHKPITYAFQKKNTESSPHQIRHLGIH